MFPFMIGGGIWPLIIAGGLGLAIGAGGAAWVQDYRIDGLRAERDAANGMIAAYEEDARRWRHASAERDRAIADLTAQLQKITADAQEAELRAIELIEAAAARADATERKLAQLRSQADAATEAERPRALSPFARSGLDWLRCRSEAGPGADPAACAD